MGEGDVPKEEARSPSAPCTPGQMGLPSEEAVGSRPWEDLCSLQEVEAPGVSAAGGTGRWGEERRNAGSSGSQNLKRKRWDNQASLLQETLHIEALSEVLSMATLPVFKAV